MKKLLLLCWFTFLFITNSIAQGIEEDDPYINRAYVGINMGVNSKSLSTVGVDAQAYVWKEKLSVVGRYNKFFSPIKSFPYGQYASVDERMFHPADGIKNGMDYEVGLNYNFISNSVSKERKIILWGTANVSYYTRQEVTDIRVSGVRAGLGKYRSIIGNYDKENVAMFRNGTNQTNYENYQFYTNFNISYVYMGVQSTRAANYKVDGGIPARRAVKVDYYVDLIFQFHRHIEDVIARDSLYQLQPFSIKVNEEIVGQHKVGARVGFCSRAARYFKPTVSGEFGILPGFHVQENDLRLQPGFGSVMYGKITLSLSITHPYKCIIIDEKR
jgi:hypothetical protein